MLWRSFGETLVTLLVVMDPIGNAPIFVSLTRGWQPREARAAALGAVAAAGALILAFALFGQVVLDYLGVSLESLSIAGGLLLLLVALEMLHERDTTGSPARSTLLVPLATPLLAGPGAIATVMVIAQREQSRAGRAGVFAAMVLVIVVVGIVLLVAERLTRALRASVVHFLTRVLGLLLAAIAVELIVDAVRSLVRQGA